MKKTKYNNKEKRERKRENEILKKTEKSITEKCEGKKRKEKENGRKDRTERNGKKAK